MFQFCFRFKDPTNYNERSIGEKISLRRPRFYQKRVQNNLAREKLPNEENYR